MAAEDAAEYHPTYREQEVDDTLDDHENRISRLEKAVLIITGYGLAKGNEIIEAVINFI